MPGSLLFIWDRLSQGGASAMAKWATEKLTVPQLPTPIRFDDAMNPVNGNHLFPGQVSWTEC